MHSDSEASEAAQLSTLGHMFRSSKTGGPCAQGPRQTLNPEKRRPEEMGHGLGLLFSYARGGLGTAIPFPRTDVVVSKANNRWRVQDRR